MRFKLSLWMLVGLSACGRFGFDGQDTGADADLGSLDPEAGVRDLGVMDVQDVGPGDLDVGDLGDVGDVGGVSDGGVVTDVGDVGDVGGISDGGDTGVGDVQDMGPADVLDTGLGVRTVTVRCSVGGRALVSGCTVSPNQECEIRAQIGTDLLIQAAPEPGFAYARTTGDANSFQPDMVVSVAAEDTEYQIDFVGVEGAAEVNLGPVTLTRANETFETIQVVPEAAFDSASVIEIDVQIPFVIQRVSGQAFQPHTHLPPGIRLHSYLLHFAPVSIGDTASATITFPNPVLGLITLQAGLTNTDPFAQRTGLTYNDSVTRGGLENDSADLVHLHGDRKTLYYRSTSANFDQVRVLTLTRPQSLLPLLISEGAVQIATPLSVVPGDTESGQVQYIEERQATVTAGTVVDVAAPGRYEDLADYVPASLPAGQDVRSVLLHFDPPGQILATASAAITFDRQILGIYSDSPSLDGSDAAFGHPLILYPPPGSATTRGALLGGPDFVLIGEDRRTIFFRIRADLATDQFRVLLEE